MTQAANGLAAGAPAFLTPRPEAARFDTSLGAWVLSRYSDVLAAFHEPGLYPTGARRGSETENKISETRMLESGSDEIAEWRVRREALAAFSSSRLTHWRERMEHLAGAMILSLASHRPVDIVREVARPWCLELALMVTGADRSEAERLSDLAARVSAAAAEPYDTALQSEAEAAGAELDRYFQKSDGSVPVPKPTGTFVALSQTLPALLANAWLALLLHPSEMARLRAIPDLMPGAIEELLRYAGIPRRLFRRATANVGLGGLFIAEGERVMLMVDSANRDPAQFAEPDCLDLSRRGARQLSLGAGPHSCAGAPLIRMALVGATTAFVERLASAGISNPVEWRGGTGFRYPASLFVRVPGAA